MFSFSDEDKDSVKFADEVFYCDHSSKNRPGKYNCKAHMRIRHTKDLSGVYIQLAGEHDHTMLKDDGLSSPVKRKLEQLDEPGGGKSAKVMQRTLQVNSRL